MFAILLKLLGLSVALLFTGWIIPGIHISSFLSAFLASIAIVLVNLFIKPVLMFLALPINVLTLGISILFINALLFMFVSYLVKGVEVDNFLSAFLGALLLSIISIGLSSWL